ncbi:inositol 1,4,5-trisphosphate receptor type 2-like [Oncorhynchus tshawytscha]|uniref:inositol 1,4,5-trisphosphate receptor type 2-like n=1 Tax=Oncorhynchus tshawytscha TaxID=74940 RepID=UPI001C3CE762|nr:inositol 1,4,5-trisphosphate receptor type 2-like [Oncorhynchus tshawytscha]
MLDKKKAFDEPGNVLRKILLTRYFGNQRLHSKSEFGSGNSSAGGGSLVQDSDKLSSSMVDIQCLLDSEGASELVIDLIVSTKNDCMFEESILLGNALLQGETLRYRTRSTTSCTSRRSRSTSSKVFYDRMRLAQQEIRATVSVNMFMSAPAEERRGRRLSLTQ